MLGIPFVKVNSVVWNVGGDHGVNDGLVDKRRVRVGWHGPMDRAKCCPYFWREANIWSWFGACTGPTY